MKISFFLNSTLYRNLKISKYIPASIYNSSEITEFNGQINIDGYVIETKKKSTKKKQYLTSMDPIRSGLVRLGSLSIQSFGTSKFRLFLRNNIENMKINPNTLQKCVILFQQVSLLCHSKNI